MKLSRKDLRMIRGALYRAIEWEESLADAWPDGPEKKEAQKSADRFRELRNRMFPGSEGDGKLLDAKIVSVYELAARSK
jgi:hypothetical protein